MKNQPEKEMQILPHRDLNLYRNLLQREKWIPRPLGHAATEQFVM